MASREAVELREEEMITGWEASREGLFGWVAAKPHWHEHFVPINAPVYSIAIQSGVATYPVADYSQTLLAIQEKLTALKSEISEFNAKVSQALEGLQDLAADRSRLRNQSVWVPIESFAPEPYEVSSRFAAVVTPEEEGFLAAFYDANLHGCGDTREEAVSNLKDAIIDAYDRLQQLEDTELGPAILKQKQVLAHHIRRVQEQ